MKSRALAFSFVMSMLVSMSELSSSDAASVLSNSEPQLISVDPDPPVAGQDAKIAYNRSGRVGAIDLQVIWGNGTTEVVTIPANGDTVSISCPGDGGSITIQDPNGTSIDFFRFLGSGV